MKRICFVINKLTDGGAERVTSIVSSYLCKNNWYDVVLVTFEKMEDEYQLDSGIRRINLCLKQPLNVGNTIKNFIMVRRALLNLGCDCYIGIDIFANLLVSFLGMTSKQKTIISERSAPRHANIRIVNKILRKILYRFADTVVFQTNGAKEEYSRLIQRKGFIIPNPVKDNLPSYSPIKKSFCASGRLVLEKNYKLLIDAFRIVHQKHPEYSLSIYGQGAMREELDHYIRQNTLEKAITLEGYYADVHTILRENEIFILSSDFEGLPNSLMEALAMGFPIISTDCPPGGPRSLINNGDNGYLVPVGNVTALAEMMSFLIENEDKRIEIGINARQIRNTYSTQLIAKKWRECIERTC